MGIEARTQQRPLAIPLRVMLAILLSALLVTGSQLFRADRYRGDAPLASSLAGDLRDARGPQSASAPRSLRVASMAEVLPPFAATPLHVWYYAGREDMLLRPSLLELADPIAFETAYGWTEKGRFTVVLLGIDLREKRPTSWRTDTIMLLTLDPGAGGAGVLSIPRDLWLPIPRHGNGRINTADFLGHAYGYPGGGQALLKDTLRHNMDIKADYFVRIDFQGFVQVIDLIGGIDVMVERTIDDPAYPGPNDESYERLYIEAGAHHFDGEMALKYARTRHGASDFDRARRQQQIVLAVLRKVTDLGLLPELLRNASQILSTLRTSVQTDLPLDKAVRLAWAAVRLDQDAIRVGVIDRSSTRPWVTPTGGQVLLPYWDQIFAVRDYVFGR